MSPRRLQLRGADQRVAVAVGLVTGVGLIAQGLRPTGSTPVDCLLLIGVATAAVWSAATAPWWALSGLAAVAAALAPPVVPLVLGIGVLLLSLGIGVVRRSQPGERAILAGGSMLVLSTARELSAFGVNTLVAVVVVTVVAALGILRRSRRVRRQAITVVAVLASLGAIGIIGLVLAGVSARPDLTAGNRTARQGLRELKSGDFEAAQISFDRAASAFERSRSDLGAVWTQPARLVPIVAQHRNAGAQIAGGASSATRTIERQLAVIDLDSLRIVDGRIDLDAVRGLTEPLTELQTALDELDAAADDADDDWLIGSIRRQLEKLRVEIAEQRGLGTKATAALAVAPEILGADGERVYFVMFTTPAEARGQGGFMGNWAELTFDEGRIEMTAFGRTVELNQGGQGPRMLTGPDDWLARYGQFGFQTGDDGSVGRFPWSNITLSPNFPSTAQVVAELYPQSGGRPIDGVISLDVEALSALVGVVGLVEPDGARVTLDEVNTASFLTRDQYEFDDTDRVDLLESVASEVVDRLVSGAVEDPLDLGRALAGPATEGRLLAWSQAPTEQAVIVTAGMDGALFGDPAADPGAAQLSLRMVNANPNKIDAYLERRVCVSRDEQLRAEVTLFNRAPRTGLPPVVIGNRVDLPDGYNRSYVTWFSSMPVESVSVDGEPSQFTSQREAGLLAASLVVDIPPRSSVTLSIKMSASVDPTSPIIVQPQPLFLPETWATAAQVDECESADYHIVSTLTPLR